MTPAELPVMWQRWSDRASSAAVLAAADAMAESYQRIAKRLVSHGGRGAPGQPPGMVTGNLRDNIRKMPSFVSGDTAYASVGSFAVYAAVQELGAIQYPRSMQYLHWVDGRGSMYLRSAWIRPHPYMSTAAIRGRTSGAFTRVARAAFLAVMAAGG